MKRNYLFIGVAALLLGSCCATKNTTETAATTAVESKLIANGKLWSSYFQQNAAEYDALCLQAFNVAQLRLDEAVAKKGSKPLAIVTDIDETFLDNSPFETYCAKKGISYSQKDWEEWTALGDAKPLAGALEFFKYADRQGVAIFYVTNRKENEREGTATNLHKYDFPLPSDSRLILRTAEKSKENRRQQIAKDYDIVLFMGDNLSDFDKDFDARTPEGRKEAVTKNKAEFGKRYIVFPNFSYGDWEGAPYGYKYSIPEAEKEAIINNNTKSFK